MQNSRHILRTVVLLLAVIPLATYGQNSSLNTFSPYTFYGIGDFATQGPGYIRSMGGAGIGYRNSLKINYMNPASYSILRQKTFLFNVEMEGVNTYSKTSAAKTSHNSINVRDLSLAFPLARGVGIGFSMTPYSSVGYRIDMDETDPFFLANNMNVVYSYVGEGNVVQTKFGLGVQVTKRLSLGADLIYYHGRLTNFFNTTISSILSTETFNSVEGTARKQVSKLGSNFGLQYDILLNEKRILTFGAAYQPKVDLRMNTTRVIYSTNIGSAAVVDTTGKENFYLPHMYTVGLSFQSIRFGMSVDYSSQLWSKTRNVDDVLNSIEFKNSQYFKVGLQYTPNPGDARHVLNRWSYRLGFRFNDYYMKINEHNIRDKAVTAGIGIPLRSAFMGTSAINVGVEFGWRGRTEDGMIGTRQFRMVREKYFKISVGLSLFGEDDWFKRFKYQ